jgi:UDP-N-acetylmuramoyl-tripeptide--D-alanyl-D-alanine ligase
MNQNTEFAIIEMGANHPGEIANLCTIADPDYGLITNIGKAHLEGFGSFEGIIKTKAELYNYVSKKDGTVFFNKDNNILTELSTDIKNKISYGTSDANFTGKAVYSPPFVHVSANFPKGKLYLNTSLTGEYNFENILATACIGHYLGVDPLKIQTALKDYRPANNRSQLIIKGELKIIMDGYNANPTSMEASIKSFLSGFKDESSHLILGDMLELGNYSEKEHRKILELIQHYQITNILLTGPVFKMAAESFPNIQAFVNVNELCTYISAHPLKSGAVLIKGSRGIRLEKVLEYL